MPGDLNSSRVNELPNNENEKITPPAGRRIGIPKGVYRFKTLEEADEWEKKLLALSRVREAARRAGANRLTLEQINREISATRKAGRATDEN